MGLRPSDTNTITANSDRWIPIVYIEQHAANLEADGVNLTTVIYPNEDHFSFFRNQRRHCKILLCGCCKVSLPDILYFTPI